MKGCLVRDCMKASEPRYNRSRNGTLPASFEQTATNPVHAICEVPTATGHQRFPCHRQRLRQPQRCLSLRTAAADRSFDSPRFSCNTTEQWTRSYAISGERAPSPIRKTPGLGSTAPILGLSPRLERWHPLAAAWTGRSISPGEDKPSSASAPPSRRETTGRRHTDPGPLRAPRSDLVYLFGRKDERHKTSA